MQVLFPATATAKLNGQGEGDAPAEKEQDEDATAFSTVFEEDGKAPIVKEHHAGEHIMARDDAVNVDDVVGKSDVVRNAAKEDPDFVVSAEVTPERALEETVRNHGTIAVHHENTEQALVSQGKPTPAEKELVATGHSGTAQVRSEDAERSATLGTPKLVQISPHSVHEDGPTSGTDDPILATVPQKSATGQPPMGTQTATAKPTTSKAEQNVTSDTPKPRHVLETVLSASVQTPVQKPDDVARILRSAGVEVITSNADAAATSTLTRVVPAKDAPIARQTHLPIKDETSRARTVVEPAVAPASAPSVQQHPISTFAATKPLETRAAPAVKREFQTERILPVGDPADTITWELRPSQAPISNGYSAVHIAPARADIPPQIAHNIAVAMQNAPSKPVEIALNPAELGRVRMVMTASETGVVVHVLAERADTLDLMRRNIDDLGRALSDLGYEDIAFAFGQNDNAADQTPDENQEATGVSIRIETETDDVPSTVVPTATRQAMISDGVDLRL